MGLVQDALWERYEEKITESKKEIERLKGSWLQPKTKEAKSLEKQTGEKITSASSYYELLKRPNIKHSHLPTKNKLIRKTSIDQVEAEIKYEGYIKRQNKEIEKLQKAENTLIPEALNFRGVVGLSNEVKQKLTKARPKTLARASRLPGITPAAISLLLVHLKKTKKKAS